MMMLIILVIEAFVQQSFNNAEYVRDMNLLR